MKRNGVLFAWLVLFCLGVKLNAGCASFVDGARISLTTAAKLQAEGAKAFAAYDGPHQLQIVAEAPDKATAHAALEGYRAERGKVVKAFQAVWAATVTANAALELYVQGKSKQPDVVGMIETVLRAVGQLKDALIALGVPVGST